MLVLLLLFNLVKSCLWAGWSIENTNQFMTGLDKLNFKVIIWFRIDLENQTIMVPAF